MGKTSIEWTDDFNVQVGACIMSEPSRCANTETALPKRDPGLEGHVMAFSTLTFRAYVAKLKGRRLGAFKAAAVKAGITFEEYISRIERGLKRCTDCGDWLDRGEFDPDPSRWDGTSSKCRGCRRERYSHEFVPAEEVSRFGTVREPIRGGDKRQARHFINRDVDLGVRPDPNDMHCVKCGHKGSDRRHEYHHHMGYSAEHFFDVLPLCSACHHEEHPENHRKPRAATGRFTTEVNNG